MRHTLSGEFLLSPYHRQSCHKKQNCLYFRLGQIIFERSRGGFTRRSSSMSGLHHVTAIAGKALQNFDFYTQVLGLRFVKRTVNFDDPSTYHFYYGDETGRPGTILTFFPWPHATVGQRGVGETSQAPFRVPLRSIGYWTERFTGKGISYQAPVKLFGETVLTFKDRDGMAL